MLIGPSASRFKAGFNGEGAFHSAECSTQLLHDGGSCETSNFKFAVGSDGTLGITDAAGVRALTIFLSGSLQYLGSNLQG